MKRVKRWTADLVILAASSVLVVSGVSKALDATGFAATLASHGHVPASLSRHAAVGVTAMELVCGMAAIALLPARSRLTRAAVVLLAAMYAAIGGYATVMTVFPPARPVGCGCFWGASPSADWSIIAIRNAGVAAVVLLAVRWMSSGRTDQRAACA